MNCTRCIGGRMSPTRDEDGDPIFLCINCGKREYVDYRPPLDIPAYEMKQPGKRGPQRAGQML